MRPGAWAWLGLGAYIIAVDTGLLWHNKKKQEKETYVTMSGVFADCIQNSKARWPIIVCWSTMTLHLFKPYLPKELRKLDPITYLSDTLYDTILIRSEEKVL